MPPAISTLTSRLGTRASGAKHVLYIDRGVVVVNKPPGLICQLDSKTKANEASVPGEIESLNQFVEDLKVNLDLPENPLPLHRLDKATTGALALALNPRHAQALALQFRAHEVQKSYLALVRGGAQSFQTRSGTISNTLNYHQGRIVTDKELPPGTIKRAAETDWEVISSSTKAPLTLLKFGLKTGLKHQLRVHAAYELKAPILGETLYANAKLSPKLTEVANIPHDFMYLHASRLSFWRYCPKRARVEVVAPLPRYFVRLCANVGIPLHADMVKGGVWVDGVRMRHDTEAEGPGNVLHELSKLNAQWFV